MTHFNHPGACLRILPLAALLVLGACAPVQLSGPIDAAMGQKVAMAAVGDGARTFSIADSPGGSVTTAAAMAGILNGTESRLIVNGPCFSACALFVLAVTNRQATEKAAIEIHHVTRGGEHDAAGTQDSIEWMEGSGLPRQIAEHARKPELYRLTPADLARAGMRP